MKIGRVPLVNFKNFGGYVMSNMVRKGDFLVFVNSGNGLATEFFVSTLSFDLDDVCSGGRPTRMLVNGCFGFKLESNHHYPLGRMYWVDRKATLEERKQFIQWMSDNGHTFNMNTLELN